MLHCARYARSGVLSRVREELYEAHGAWQAPPPAAQPNAPPPAAGVPRKPEVDENNTLVGSGIKVSELAKAWRGASAFIWLLRKS